MQQQGFPIAAIKIISPAEVPKSASSPRKKAMLLAGLLLGGMLGVLIGTARELLPKPVRKISTLRQEVGINCAGLLPGEKSRDDAGWKPTRLRTIERLAQACEANRQKPGGLLVAIAPLSPGLEDHHALPAALAAHLSHNGTRRVLLIHEEKLPPEAIPGPNAKSPETVLLQKVLESWSEQAGTEASDVDLNMMAKFLRDEFSFVLVALRPLSLAEQSDPHSWSYDSTILRVPWGQVLPGFVTDALMDHPRFHSSLATTVLEDAELATARRYISAGSYEELEINA